MRYSTEPKYGKYVRGYASLSFDRKFNDKYAKRLMDTAKKTGIDSAKTTSKRVVQKPVEVIGDLIGNTIVEKLTSLGKSKDKGKTKNVEEIYIPTRKRQ